MKSRNAKVIRDGNPIFMEDGKIIEMDESIIIEKVIVEGMKYISNMTIGLSTGQLSMDNEYIDLRNKIIEDIIEEQSIKVRNKLGQEEKIIKSKYKDGYKIHKEGLEKLFAQNRENSKDNFIRINLNDNIVNCEDDYKMIDHKIDYEKVMKIGKKVAKKRVAKKQISKKKIAKKRTNKKTAKRLTNYDR